MRKNQIYICFHFYYDNFKIKNWKDEFFQIADRFQFRFNIKYNRFGFSYENNETRSKDYLYTQKNIEKYKQQFKNNARIISIDVCALLDKETYRSNPEFYFRLWKNTKIKPYADFYLHIEQDIINIHDWKELFLEIYNLADELGDIKYGLSHPVESEKMPAFLFLGIPSNLLNEEESNRVRKWIDNQNKYKQLIRDIYYANILSNGHIVNNDKMINEIKNVVGNANVIDKGSKKIIYLPYLLDEYNFKKEVINNTINKIRKIVDDNKKLM